MSTTLAYDPSGAIGLFDQSPILHIRFDETETSRRPRDATKVMEDFEPIATSFSGNDYAATMPAVVDASLGRGRKFEGEEALFAQDIDSGSTLLSRDMSAMMVLLWDPANQPAGLGTVVARGLGQEPPEEVSFALHMEVVSAPNRTARLRWGWVESGTSTLTTSTGVEVSIPDGYTLITWTRRWISPTEVVLRYYIAGDIVGEETVATGNIGGGTTGTMQIGAKADDDDGSLSHFWAGTLDELMLLDRVLSIEEIEDHWLRMSKWQPLGVELMRQNIDPGFPISDDRYSGAQADIRLAGQALGFAGARIENFRRNFLPDRAYGSTLRQWQEALRVTTQPGHDEETVRKRTLAKLRQRKGSAIPGIAAALADLVDGGVDDLEYFAFTNTIRDELPDLNVQRWQIRPVQATSWTSVSNTAQASLVAGDYPFDGALDAAWHRGRRPCGGDAREADIISKLSITTAPSGIEAGVYFEDQVNGNYLLLGIRNDSGTYRLVSESWVRRASQGVVQHAVLGSATNAWLWLRQLEEQGTWRGAVSFTSETDGYTETVDITHPTAAQWAGFYARTFSTIASPAQVNVDYVLLRQPYGDRPFHGYVLLDEALGYDPDVSAARDVLRGLSQAHVHVAFITKRNLIYDDQENGCDQGPMGELP